jgi:hypothetical protein
MHHGEEIFSKKGGRLAILFQNCHDRPVQMGIKDYRTLGK